ncbi:MAG: hypothetical protein AB1600_06940, partial [Bacteroidota bacterium]
MIHSIVKITLFFPVVLAAQYLRHIDSFPVQTDSTVQTFTLSKNFVVVSSLSIFTDSNNVDRFSYNNHDNTVTVYFGTPPKVNSTVYISY